MNAKELANKLNGCKGISRQDAQLAKYSGLVIVYGASDDLMEFDGAITDEIGCYGGGIAHLNANSVIQDCDEACEHCNVENIKKNAHKIEAIWNKGGYCWSYKTEIPHESFDIREDSDNYCRGIIFRILDL